MQQTRRQVLDALADGPISGPEIATQHGISRAAVWKHVEALREDGFDIESHSKGYVLVDTPEFGGAGVEHHLETPVDIEYHDRIPSTNDRARELAADGAATIGVLADEQTGARGRLNRAWASPSGGVWLSLIYRPDLPPSQMPVYTLAAAVATTAALRDVGVDAEIKWPNDVLVDGQKIVGILTEMEGEADRVSWVIVGIGINANVDRAAVPDCATTVEAEVGTIDRAALTADLIDRFETLRQTPEDVPDAWKELSTTLGQVVRVETPNEMITGEAVDIEFPGTLVVETDDGTRRITAGDCEHLRPA